MYIRLYKVQLYLAATIVSPDVRKAVEITECAKEKCIHLYLIR